MEAFFARLDASLPEEYLFHPVRVSLDRNRLVVGTLYQTAMQGSESVKAYDLMEDDERARFLATLFHETSAMQGNMERLHSLMVDAGLTGLPVELLEMHLESFRNDYDARRLNVALAIAKMEDAMVSRDAILRQAVADLHDGIRVVGGGDAARAADMACKASYHLNRRHFLDFLPVVGPSDTIIYRRAQLERGAVPLEV